MEHDKIIDCLTNLSKDIPEVFETFYNEADKNPLCKRLYVKGISFDTTSETFRNAFSVYGPMEDCSLAFDRISNKNKGYGFVVYKSLDSVEEALRDPIKLIDGRKTQCSIAAIRDGQVDANVKNPLREEEHIDLRKLFIRNLSESTTTETLKNAFAQYGELESVDIPIDKVTGLSKLYGFIIFKTSHAANKALRHPQKEINGRMTTVFLAAQGRAQVDGGLSNQFGPSFQPHGPHHPHNVPIAPNNMYQHPVVDALGPMNPLPYPVDMNQYPQQPSYPNYPNTNYNHPRNPRMMAAPRQFTHSNNYPRPHQGYGNFNPNPNFGYK
eukprot:gene17146-22660_t